MMQNRFTKNVCLALILLSVMVCNEIMAQAQIKAATISTAGGKTQSDSYKLWNLIGQAVQPGTATSVDYSLHGNLKGLTRDVELPSVTHSPLTTPQPQGSDISIQATAKDNINVAACTLLYREGGAQTFASSEMTLNSGIYTGTIPGSNVGERGVEYYIMAEDVNGNRRETALYSVRVAIGDAGISNSSPQPSGTAQSAYRLISLPLDATSKNPADVLEGVLGTYDNTKWRFFELETDQTYTEYPNTGDMNPGKAFWLIVKDADKTINTGAGNTIKTDTTYSMPLSAGWTLIGNPFDFNIPQSNVTLQSGAILDIRSYNGNWSNFTASMTPFAGYAVYSDAATNLIIDPVLSAVGKLKTEKMLAEKEGEWMIGIEARSQDALDTDTRAMSMTKASEEYDPFDRPEPPVIGEYVSVYFPHPEWEKISKNYCTDARPKLEAGDIWQFEIRTNIKDNVSLTFTGIENVPTEYEIWFVDEVHKLLHNVREKASYEVSVSTSSPKKLMLIVGKAEFIQQKLTDYEMIPTVFSLDQNFPNPFNPTTIIRYGLPKDEHVSLKVYNLLGQEVVTLMHNVDKKAGYHAVVWNGTNGQGNQVASGMYIYLLQAGNYTNVKKMLLLR